MIHRNDFFKKSTYDGYIKKGTFLKPGVPAKKPATMFFFTIQCVPG